MTASSLPQPSSRLLRAASAEQAELGRHRARLRGERDRLLTDVRRIEDELAALERRSEVLAQLVGPAAGAEIARSPAEPASRRAAGPDAAAPDAVWLRGPAIRETAVQLLVGQPRPVEAIHYRRWYDLLVEAGYAVAGKDPRAVFLTQISRSPVVRRTTEPGVYELDRQAPLRLRGRLERLQSELRDVAVGPSGPVDLASVRARRHELDLTISQHERALDEALRALQPAGRSAAGTS